MNDIDLPESYEDSEKEANDDEMRECMTYTIEQIKTMLEKITQGEWPSFNDPDIREQCWQHYDSLQDRTDRTPICISNEDATFIASAPSYCRYLLGEVERLQETLELELAKGRSMYKEIAALKHDNQEELDKTHRAIEAAKAWTEYWQRGDMINDEFPLMSELQACLSSLKGGKV